MMRPDQHERDHENETCVHAAHAGRWHASRETPMATLKTSTNAVCYSMRPPLTYLRAQVAPATPFGR
jgi:hypothetical protein